MIGFYRSKKVDFSEHGCTKTNLANNCPHISKDTNIWRKKSNIGRNSKKVVGGPSIVFTRKKLVDEMFLFPKSTISCKTTNKIDASQLQPYPMCQPKELCKSLDHDSETRRFTPWLNKTVGPENMSRPFLKEQG